MGSRVPAAQAPEAASTRRHPPAPTSDLAPAAGTGEAGEGLAPAPVPGEAPRAQPNLLSLPRAARLSSPSSIRGAAWP